MVVDVDVDGSLLLVSGGRTVRRREEVCAFTAGSTENNARS